MVCTNSQMPPLLRNKSLRLSTGQLVPIKFGKCCASITCRQTDESVEKHYDPKTIAGYSHFGGIGRDYVRWRPEADIAGIVSAHLVILSSRRSVKTTYRQGSVSKPLAVSADNFSILLVNRSPM